MYFKETFSSEGGLKKCSQLKDEKQYILITIRLKPSGLAWNDFVHHARGVEGGVEDVLTLRCEWVENGGCC